MEEEGQLSSCFIYTAPQLRSIAELVNIAPQHDGAVVSEPEQLGDGESLTVRLSRHNPLPLAPYAIEIPSQAHQGTAYLAGQNSEFSGLGQGRGFQPETKTAKISDTTLSGGIPRESHRVPQLRVIHATTVVNHRQPCRTTI